MIPEAMGSGKDVSAVDQGSPAHKSFVFDKHHPGVFAWSGGIAPDNSGARCDSSAV